MLAYDEGRAIEEVMDHLRVDADQAYNTSRAVANDAQELREELAGLQRDWDDLSRGWSGVASSGDRCSPPSGSRATNQ
jgi:Proteins of 100 residues with WXG